MMETVETTTTASATSSRGLFGTKIPTSAAFLVGLLLFLLPFAQVKCNGNAFAENSGVGIALGTKWKEVKTFFGGLGDSRDNDQTSEKTDPNMFAIAALALGLMGFVLAILNLKKSYAAISLIGILAAVGLIGMLIDLKSQVKDKSVPKGPGDFNLNTNAILTVDATPWFYIAVIAFMAAAFFSWQRGKMRSG